MVKYRHYFSYFLTKVSCSDFMWSLQKVRWCLSSITYWLSGIGFISWFSHGASSQFRRWHHESAPVHPNENQIVPVQRRWSAHFLFYEAFCDHMISVRRCWFAEGGSTLHLFQVFFPDIWRVLFWKGILLTSLSHHLRRRNVAYIRQYGLLICQMIIGFKVVEQHAG